jgi:hypothetical protein
MFSVRGPCREDGMELHFGDTGDRQTLCTVNSEVKSQTVD